MPADRAVNIHATAIVLGDRGVLIAGPSGSGKSALALSLLSSFGRTGRFARLVGDDQLFVEARAGRLVATCPDTIAGLAEVRGLGPRRLSNLNSAVIDLAVRLTDPSETKRFSDPESEHIAGVHLPLLVLPANNVAASLLAVAAWLEAPPFLPRSGRDAP